MMEIKQITTVDELYQNQGAKTGQIVVDAVVDYIRRVTSHSADDAAHFLNVNRRWLSESLLIFVGVSLHDFIKQWRLKQAVDLLDDETLSLHEVALRCGYKETKSLIQAFRHLYGTTPLTYRTGHVRRNSLYHVNNDVECRKKAEENARQLKQRKQKQSPDIG